MPLGGLYGIVMGYLVARRQFIGRRTLEVASMVNYALPGTIVGIAYLIAFNDPPLALTGGALIIIACYVFRYSPSGIRATIVLVSIGWTLITVRILENMTELALGPAAAFSVFVIAVVFVVLGLV